jgi:hypothetical protein
LAPAVAMALAQLGRRQHWTGDDLVFVGVTGSFLERVAGDRRRPEASSSVVDGMRSPSDDG